MNGLRRVLVEDGELKLANLVTLSRGLLIVPILALLLAGQHLPAVAVYLLAASTDLVDGWLARREGRASAYGAQLDATIDNVFSVAILAFLLMDRPGLGARQGLALALLFGAPIAYLGLSWLLTRRVLMFHFWSAKLGALLLFLVWPLVAFTGHESWIALAAAVVTLSRLEQIVFILRGGRALDAPHLLAQVS